MHEITRDDMRWVRSVAYQVNGRMGKASVDDLEGDGMVALVRVAARYDDSLGATFRTYAYPRVRGAMIDGLREWYGRNPETRLRFEALGGDDWADVMFISAVEDDHDEFELDLTLDGKLSSPEDRMLVSLLALEDLDKQEVARIFQVSPSAISHRLRKLRAHALLAAT